MPSCWKHCNSCTQDNCTNCGNSICDSGDNHSICPSDCDDTDDPPDDPDCPIGGGTCGDGKCCGNETKASCPDDCGEESSGCPEGGGKCGDGKCCGDETSSSCSKDCKINSAFTCDGWDAIKELNPFEYDKDGKKASSIMTQFGDRFTKFIADMKLTSVFSIPGQIFGGGPSGSGSSVFSYNGGETLGGQQEVDFSNWSAGLAVFRGCLYIVFSAIALRIVTLKS